MRRLITVDPSIQVSTNRKAVSFFLPLNICINHFKFEIRILEGAFEPISV